MKKDSNVIFSFLKSHVNLICDKNWILSQIKVLKFFFLTLRGVIINKVTILIRYKLKSYSQYNLIFHLTLHEAIDFFVKKMY